jgi:phosphoribosyl-AMP cyclohydrolase
MPQQNTIGKVPGNIFILASQASCGYLDRATCPYGKINVAADPPMESVHNNQLKLFQDCTMSTSCDDLSFAPDFSKGLLPAIVQDHSSGEILMLAYMNELAWQKTLQSGEAHYWSRSRQQLWHKGATSGNTQKVLAVRLDCDNDAILLIVEQKGGAACHTGRRSCFYREWKNRTVRQCSPQIFDPKKVYGK